MSDYLDPVFVEFLYGRFLPEDRENVDSEGEPDLLQNINEFLGYGPCTKNTFSSTFNHFIVLSICLSKRLALPEGGLTICAVILKRPVAHY